MERNFGKIAMPLFFIYILMDFTKDLSPSPRMKIFIVFCGVLWGVVVGFFVDIKRSKKIEIKELNKNIKKISKMDFTKKVNNDDIVDQIERLEKLKKNNSISEDEFFKLKNRIINQ